MSTARAVVLACGILGASVTLAQSNLGDFSDAPMAKFKPADMEMLWSTIETVSATRKPGKSQTWENAATGNGGSIKLLNVFATADGRDCRRLKVDNHAKNLKGSSKQIVCMDPDGKWMIDANARPAPKP